MSHCTGQGTLARKLVLTLIVNQAYISLTRMTTDSDVTIEILLLEFEIEYIFYNAPIFFPNKSHWVGQQIAIYVYNFNLLYVKLNSL